MGKRASKPTGLRALEGGRSNSLTKPDQMNEPKPRPVAPGPPKDIDTRAKKFWKGLAPKLERLGLLTEVDERAFAVLCQVQSFIFQLQDDLRQMQLFEDKAEHLKELRQLYQVFRQYAGEFGLTPRGRVGLTVGGGFGDDEGKDLLS